MHNIISAELINQLVTMFILASLGFGVTMALTPFYTYFAYKHKLWKRPRTTAVTGEAAPIFSKLHAAKHRRNIPMMAGVVFVAVIAAVTLLLNVNNGQAWLPLIALLGGAAVGFVDDIINVRGLGGGARGLRASVKFGLMTVLGLAGALYFYYGLGAQSVHLPFPPYALDVGWLIVPIFAFVVIATSNAVNITDGLDGLAGGLAAMAFTTFGIIALLQGNMGVAGFCFTVVGALMSYVWFNIYPARFFMSDVGSFSLGTALGVVAMLTNTLFLLPIIGLVFVIDAGTSLIQILSKKIFKRKVFLSAPIHHHFEALGWPEAKVTMRFWLIGAASCALGLILALTGGYIS
jgi:phospho-N-acetylmuramoyl-pentapeptide-transferase